jgi:hypothetical protein
MPEKYNLSNQNTLFTESKAFAKSRKIYSNGNTLKSTPYFLNYDLGQYIKL